MLKTDNGKGRIRLHVLLVSLLAVSLAFALVPSIPFGADTAFAEDKAKLEIGGSIPYDGDAARCMTIDGTVAYYGEPLLSTPSAGSYTKSPLKGVTHVSYGPPYASTHIASALWFGWGGPGFESDMWPSTWIDGSPMTDDRYRALTQILITEFFTRHGPEALQNCSEEFCNWIGENLFSNWEGKWHTHRNTESLIGSRSGTVPKSFKEKCFQLNTGSGTRTVLGFIPGGIMGIERISANAAVSDKNDLYSLEGAEYEIYDSADCSNAIATLTTNVQGLAASDFLVVGKYYVKETKSSEGYARDATVYEASVKNGDSSKSPILKIKSKPQVCAPEYLAQSYDSETYWTYPQGGATFADAQFIVEYYSGYYNSEDEARSSGTRKRDWVLKTNSEGKLLLDDSLVEYGQPLFHTTDGKPCVPIGTLLIYETGSPSGYQLNDTHIYACQTRPDGTENETISQFSAPRTENKVYRGDIEFIKARESNQKRLEGIPFRITSNTTGESHIIVTNKYGYASTSASWNPHFRNTNLNDDAVSENGAVDESKLDSTAGIWFGQNMPYEERSALPYDHYAIEELRVSANKGLELTSVPDVFIGDREGYTYNLGTFTGQGETDDQKGNSDTSPAYTPNSTWNFTDSSGDELPSEADNEKEIDKEKAADASGDESSERTTNPTGYPNITINASATPLSKTGENYGKLGDTYDKTGDATQGIEMLLLALGGAAMACIALGFAVTTRRKRGN